MLDLNRLRCRRASRLQAILLVVILTWCVVFITSAFNDKCQKEYGDQNLKKFDSKLSLLENSIFEERMFDYKGKMNKLNKAKVAQNDPRLIQLIRDYYITPPSTEVYSLGKPFLRDFSEDRISSEISQSLHKEHNGFFIECGAFDGEYKSTTLHFERERHWRGLLIEADPISFARMRSKNRKAYMLNACLSTRPYPVMMKFNVLGEIGRVIDGEAANWYLEATKGRQNEIEVQCFPLYSILLALNQLNVDFFTLDIEGVELDVLRTVPFDLVNITTLLVEFSHINEGLEPLQDLLQNNGYIVLRTLTEDLLVSKLDKIAFE